MNYLIDIMLGAPWLDLSTRTSKKFDSIDGCAEFLFEVFKRNDLPYTNRLGQSFDYGDSKSYGMQIQVSRLGPDGEVGRIPDAEWLRLCETLADRYAAIMGK